MKLTHALLGEHGILYRLLDSVEEQSPHWSLEEAHAGAVLLGEALVAHARVEDDLLFPALERRGAREDAPLDVMKQEHGEIEDSFREIARTSDSSQARSLLLHVAAIAREHFEREEQVVFPIAEEILGSEELEKMGREWAERRRVAVVEAG